MPDAQGRNADLAYLHGRLQNASSAGEHNRAATKLRQIHGQLNDGKLRELRGKLIVAEKRNDVRQAGEIRNAIKRYMGEAH